MLTVEVDRTLLRSEAELLWRDVDVVDHAASLPADRPLMIVCEGERVAIVDKIAPHDIIGFRMAARSYPTTGGVLRSKGIRNRAQVFGYLAGNPLLRRASCRSCSGAADFPRQHAGLADFAQVLSDRLKTICPDQWSANAAAVADVEPEWLLPGGLWTSGVLNATSALPYHRDRNNFDAWSAMPVVRRGVTGGRLHFPELSHDGQPLVAPCDDGDVLFFNGQEWMHGVTPMKRRMTDGYRFSAVYYPVRKMANCLPLAAELKRGNDRRTANEVDLIERQRAQGNLQ